MDGKRWKGAEIPKALSAFMKILGFRLISPKSYGTEEDKPEWWPKKTKWKTFRNPSKASKDECTKVIRRLLAFHGIDAEKFYVKYPSEEQDSSKSSKSSDSDMEVPRGSTDQNNSFHESFGECRDDEDDTEDDRMREMINNYEKMKKRRGPRGKYVLKN